MLSVGFLVGWQTGDDDEQRAAVWRRGIFHGMVGVAVIGAVGICVDDVVSWCNYQLALIDARAAADGPLDPTTLVDLKEQTQVSLLMGGNWLLGQLNMVSMWTGVTWGMCLGLRIQEGDVKRVSTIIISAILLAVVILSFAISKSNFGVEVDGVEPSAFAHWLRGNIWVLSLAPLVAWPWAQRENNFVYVLLSICIGLLATHWLRGQIIGCSILMIVAALALLVPPKRYRWHTFLR